MHPAKAIREAFKVFMALTPESEELVEARLQVKFQKYIEKQEKKIQKERAAILRDFGISVARGCLYVAKRGEKSNDC